MAVSRDAKSMVILSTDEEDFSGSKVQTVRFLLLPSGRVEKSVVVFSTDEHSDEKEIAKRKRNVDQVEARLAKTEWQLATRARSPLGPCAGSVWASLDAKWAATEGDQPSRRRFDAERLDIEFDYSSQALHIRRRDVTGAEREGTVLANFPSPGKLNGRKQAGCGSTIHLGDVFLVPSLNLLLMYQQPLLGGDECTGNLAIDNVSLLALPPSVRR